MTPQILIIEDESSLADNAAIELKQVFLSQPQTAPEWRLRCADRLSKEFLTRSRQQDLPSLGADSPFFATRAKLIQSQRKNPGNFLQGSLST
jgi:hypothetical protein